MIRRSLTATFALLLALSCDGGGGGRSIPVDDGALVVTSDYQAGAYSVVDLDTLAAYGGVEVVHEDSTCRATGPDGLIYVIARYGADAIDVVDPRRSWSVISEYSVGASTNPQDIAVVSADLAYVARMGDPSLLMVHPTDGTQLGTVDLSSLADADGNPEAAWLLPHGDEILVALQKLGDGFEPTGCGSIAILEAATGEITGEVELTGSNVYGKLRYGDAVERVVLVETGVFGVLDGGIEYLDPADRSVSGFLVTEEELGGDLSDAVIVSPSKGYAVIGVPHGAEARTSLVTFDPSTGEKLDELIVQDSWSLGFLELSAGGDRVWVADRTPTRPGIRIFDTTSDDQVADDPTDVGLPPFMICFAE